MHENSSETTMEGRLRLILTYNLNLYNLYLCRMYVTVMQMLLHSFLLLNEAKREQQDLEHGMMVGF